MAVVIDAQAIFPARARTRGTSSELAERLRQVRLTLLHAGAGIDCGRYLERDLLPLLCRRTRDRDLMSFAADGSGAPRLERRARRRGSKDQAEIAVVLDHWDGDPLLNLKLRIRGSIARAGVTATAVSSPVARSLCALSNLLDARFLLILAGFDEFLRIPESSKPRQDFLHEVNQILLEPDLPVNMLICAGSADGLGARYEEANG